jgi:hypothetical protein
VKPSICHITVLNPLRHSRIFYKLALSQHKLGHEVSIIGQGEREKIDAIQLLGVAPFGRLSLRRLFYSLWILPLAARQRAAIYVLHSPELLGLGLLLKWLTGARLIYDVHEDYRVNLLGAQHYPSWLRKPLAGLVRRWERLALRWLDAVSYAEDCYQNILKAPQNKAFLLRNKFSSAAAKSISQIAISEQPYLLYCGTIAADWGLGESLDIWEHLNNTRSIDLVVAGHSHRPEVIADLLSRVAQSPHAERFHLIGGLTYLPYADILRLIENCAAGLGLYHPLPHIRNKIPTKFYEFMAHDRPLLFTDLPEWRAFDQQHQLGLPLGEDLPPETIWQTLDSWAVKHDPNSFSWESEVPEMARMLKAVAGGGGGGRRR